MRGQFSANTGQLSLFTTTFVTSPSARGHDVNNDAISWSEAHRVKTSVSPGAVRACLLEPVPVCGGNTSASSALSDHRLSLLRTLRALADGGSLRLRRHWPRSGTGGLTFVSELATSITTMSATVSSSLLPTLTVCGNYNVAGLSPNSGDGLVTALRRRGLLPTLTARDWKSGSKSTWKTNSRPLSEEIGSTLCPQWCEQFMGFPAGWTELSVSAIASYRSRRRKRGKGSAQRWAW